MFHRRRPPRPLGPAPHRLRRRLGGSEDAASLLSDLLRDADREICALASLDRRHRVLAVDVVSVGSVAATFMAPREIYRQALLRGAAAVVVAHNHPSGDPAPSADDEQITRRLESAGLLLGVPLLDHIVVGDERWVSLCAVAGPHPGQAHG